MSVCGDTLGILAIDEFTNGIPTWTPTKKVFIASGMLDLAEEVGDLGEDGEFSGGDALFETSASQNGTGMVEIDATSGALANRLQSTLKIIDAGSTRTKTAVLIAEPVEVGASGESALPAVGEGVAAERRVGRTGAFARHHGRLT
jgi:hypothetical protein